MSDDQEIEPVEVPVRPRRWSDLEVTVQGLFHWLALALVSGVLLGYFAPLKGWWQ